MGHYHLSNLVPSRGPHNEVRIVGLLGVESDINDVYLFPNKMQHISILTKYVRIIHIQLKECVVDWQFGYIWLLLLH